MVHPLHIVLAIVASALLTWGCTPPTQPVQPVPATAPAADQIADSKTKGEALVLASYAVPAGHAPKMTSVLKNLLTRGEEPVGRISRGPNDKLVVVAPESIHAGVRDLVADLKASNAPPPQVKTVNITYWLLLGRPAATEQTGTFKGLEGALTAIRTAQGPTTFELVETLAVQSLDGDRASAQGREAQVSQVASVTDQQLIADIEIKAHRHFIRTRISTAPGKLTVLGQVGHTEKGEATSLSSGQQDATLFYVVRAEVVEDGK